MYSSTVHHQSINHSSCLLSEIAHQWLHRPAGQGALLQLQLETTGRAGSEARRMQMQACKAKQDTHLNIDHHLHYCELLLGQILHLHCWYGNDLTVCNQQWRNIYTQHRAATALAACLEIYIYRCVMCLKIQRSDRHDS